LEMLVADMGGTIACVSIGGVILWDAQLSGRMPFTPTVRFVLCVLLLDIRTTKLRDSKFD
jgi:hypothetical protein